MNDLTPQSMHSPVSPYAQPAKQSFTAQRPCFFTSPQPELPSMEQPARGLGIYECPLPQSHNNVQGLPPSPQPSDSWSHSSMMEPQEYPSISQQPPDLSTAAFDPFSGFPSNSANQGIMTTSSPEAPGLVYCQTPPSTEMHSHRNSVSSEYSPSDSYSQQGSEYYATPKVKMEDGHEWYRSPSNENVFQRGLTTHGLPAFSNGVSPIHGPAEDPYKATPADWSRPNPTAYSLGFDNMTAESARSPFDAAPILPSVNRIKKKRQRTTPEEATHECRICGKLFKRSYNWKSHMETHNPERKYPHPCTAVVAGQPCSKKFQRKTDLERHYDSVSSGLIWPGRPMT